MATQLYGKRQRRLVAQVQRPRLHRRSVGSSGYEWIPLSERTIPCLFGTNSRSRRACTDNVHVVDDNAQIVMGKLLPGRNSRLQRQADRLYIALMHLI